MSLKVASSSCAALAAVSGLIAAYKWYKASRVDIIPFEEVGGVVREVPSTDVAVWINALKLTLKKSGRLNRTAAAWTALSVLLTAISVALAALADFGAHQ